MATPGELIESFKLQAGFASQLGSPFTAALLEAAADSLRRGGFLRQAIGDWPGDPMMDVLPLRIAGALHGAVLAGKSDGLAKAYPKEGRMGDAAAAWSIGEGFLESNPQWLAQWLASPPQTNEVRRSCGLIAGLFVIARKFGRPLALLELGASAGLNQNLDAFAYRNDVWQWGAHDDIVIDTEWRGAPPPVGLLEIASRAACDQNPLDVSRAEDRLKLAAYVWPDQHDRMKRLQAAMNLARTRRSLVEKADAAAWTAARLAELRPGYVTVVYHSVFYLYPPPETRRKIAAAIETAGVERATADAPLAWLRFELEALIGGPPDSKRMLLDLVTWPGGERRILAEVDPHGRHVAWL